MNTREVTALCFLAADSGAVLALHVSPTLSFHAEASLLAVEAGRKISASLRHSAICKAQRHVEAVALVASSSPASLSPATQTPKSAEGSSSTGGKVINTSATVDASGASVPVGDVVALELGQWHRAVGRVIGASVASGYVAAVIARPTPPPSLAPAVLESVVTACRALNVSDAAFVHRSLSLMLVCEEVMHQCVAACGSVDAAQVADWVLAMQQRSHFVAVESLDECLCVFEEIGTISAASVAGAAGQSKLRAGKKPLRGKKAQKHFEREVERLQNTLWTGQRPELLLREAGFAVADGVPDSNPVRAGSLVGRRPVAVTHDERSGTISPRKAQPDPSAIVAGASFQQQEQQKQTQPAAQPSSLTRRTRVAEITAFDAPAAPSPLAPPPKAPFASAPPAQTSSRPAAHVDVRAAPLGSRSTSPQSGGDGNEDDGNVSDHEARAQRLERRRKEALEQRAAEEDRKKRLAALDDIFVGTPAPPPPAQPQAQSSRNDKPAPLPSIDEIFDPFAAPLATHTSAVEGPTLPHATATTAFTAAATPATRRIPLRVTPRVALTETIQLKANKARDGAMSLDVAGEIAVSFAEADARAMPAPAVGARDSVALFFGDEADPFSGGGSSGASATKPTAKSFLYFVPGAVEESRIRGRLGVADDTSNDLEVAVKTLKIAFDGPIDDIRAHPDFVDCINTPQDARTFTLTVTVIRTGVEIPAGHRCDEVLRDASKPTTVLVYHVDARAAIDGGRLPVQCRTQWSLGEGEAAGASVAHHQLKAMVVANPDYFTGGDSDAAQLTVELPRKPSGPIATSENVAATSGTALFARWEALRAVQAVPPLASATGNAAAGACRWVHRVAPAVDPSTARLMLAARFVYSLQPGDTDAAAALHASEVVRIRFSVPSAARRSDGKTPGAVAVRATDETDDPLLVTTRVCSGACYDFYF